MSFSPIYMSMQLAMREGGEQGEQVGRLPQRPHFESQSLVQHGLGHLLCLELAALLQMWLATAVHCDRCLPAPFD